MKTILSLTLFAASLFGQHATSPQLRECPPDSTGAMQIPIAFTVPIPGTGTSVAIVQCARLDMGAFKLTPAGTSGPAILSVIPSAPTTAPAFAEVPTGAIDGTNLKFTLAFSPVPANSLLLTRNGLVQAQGIDYTLAGNVITFTASPTNAPQPGDFVIAAVYFH